MLTRTGCCRIAIEDNAGNAVQEPDNLALRASPHSIPSTSWLLASSPFGRERARWRLRFLVVGPRPGVGGLF